MSNTFTEQLAVISWTRSHRLDWGFTLSAVDVWLWEQIHPYS